MIRVVLAVLGGIVAAVVAAVVEDSLGTPTFVQLLAMTGAITLILLLTATRSRKTEDDPAELRRQLDHHRRELYRLQARYQRKGVLTAAEISAWFRNKRTLAGLRKQLQNANTSYQPDAIDTAPPPAPVSALARLKEFFRQPAVSLFIVLFLISLALAYPLAVAAQSILSEYLAAAGPLSQTEEPDSVLVAGVTATNTRPPATNTSTPTETEPTRLPSSTATATVPPTSQPTDEPTTATAQPTTEPTTTMTATPTATPTAAATATTQPTILPTPTPSPPGTPLPTLPPAPTATSSPTPTFLPVGTLPAECSGGTLEVEPNNTFETAQGPLAPGTTICGYLDDVYDFYYVEVAAPGRLTATLQNVEIEPGTPPLNLLKLFTAGTAPMEWCCFDRRDRIELTIDVNFGRYYILVDTREIVGLPYVLAVRYEAAGS